MKGGDRDVLILRYLDGTAGPQDMESLNGILREDADAREFLRTAAFQALTVADLGRGADVRAPRAGEPRRWNSLPLAAAAAILLVAGFGAVWLLRSERAVQTVVRSTGAVTWTSAAGDRLATDLEPGAALGRGTLTLEGARSGAELRLPDGSTMTVAGDSEISFAGSLVTVRRGSITLEARPRPKDRPLVLRTPTAEAEVLGTCFTLSAEAGATMVTVGSGRVRLRRLVDGASTDVPEGRMAVATLDATSPLESRDVPPLVAGWSRTFGTAPPATWQGEWVPADATGPGRLKNVLDVSYRRRDGTVVPAYVVSVRDPSGFATIRPDTVLRVRWRVGTPQIGALLLISVLHPDGRFAGNFQVDLRPDAFAPDVNGWRVFSAPVSSLDGRYPEGARLPTLGRATLVFIACYSPKGVLEVAEVAFD